MSIILLGIYIMFLAVLTLTKIIPNTYPGIILKIFFLWLMLSNIVLHAEFAKLKTKTEFHYIDSIYRIKKLKEKNSKPH